MDALINKQDIHQIKFVEAAPIKEIELKPRHVLLEIDKFAFTANNITYAVFGDVMAYWKFFPAQDGWGKLPVWGFAQVVKSEHEEVKVGERFYGFYPMSTHLIAKPGNVGKSGFIDITAHRLPLPVIYNQYTRNSTDPGYNERFEDFQALYRPLFMTSFLLDDFFSENRFFDSHSILLTSASGKTALGLAFLLHHHRKERAQPIEIVGLTSERNIEFTQSLGCYDKVVPYDHFESLPIDKPVSLADFAGNGELLSKLHQHFSNKLKYCCLVGTSHWEQHSGAESLEGVKPIMFFAPSQAKKRIEDWGPIGLHERFASVWTEFMKLAVKTTEVEQGAGTEEVKKVYLDMLNGHASPNKGHVLTLHEDRI